MGYYTCYSSIWLAVYDSALFGRITIQGLEEQSEKFLMFDIVCFNWRCLHDLLMADILVELDLTYIQLRRCHQTATPVKRVKLSFAIRDRSKLN